MSTIDDLEAVAAVVGMYVDGASGDVATLERAFHPQARMFGRFGATLHDIPITEFFALVAQVAGKACGPAYRAKVVSIDVHNDIATAVLAEEDYLGADFIDVFSLQRIDGSWKIVNKAYTVTGRR